MMILTMRLCYFRRLKVKLGSLGQMFVCVSSSLKTHYENLVNTYRFLQSVIFFQVHLDISLVVLDKK